MRTIVIVVPSLHPAGPVKGAIALANALARTRPVTLFAVKPGPGADAPIEPRVTVLSPSVRGGLRSRRAALKARLVEGGGRRTASVISYCLSADGLALSCRRYGRIICSVRGNLPRNYRFDYGPLGAVAAAAHLTALRWADATVAMSETMADQVARFVGRRPAIIGNFVDEGPLTSLRRPPSAAGAPLRFAFLGNLSHRKQPLLLLDAMASLAGQGQPASLDVVGGGPLSKSMADAVASRGLGDRVTLHGQMASPYSVLAGADALVLPSLSEGLSRAALEALYLGVPAVLRDVDGNRELVRHGQNGCLFSDDRDLADAMNRAAGLRRSATGVDNLLPPAFRQARCAERYLALAEDDA